MQAHGRGLASVFLEQIKIRTTAREYLKEHYSQELAHWYWGSCGYQAYKYFKGKRTKSEKILFNKRTNIQLAMENTLNATFAYRSAGKPTVIWGFPEGSSIIDTVPEDMLELIHPHWKKFPPVNPMWHYLLVSYLLYYLNEVVKH